MRLLHFFFWFHFHFFFLRFHFFFLFAFFLLERRLNDIHSVLVSLFYLLITVLLQDLLEEFLLAHLSLFNFLS
ncbi:MAG: hypothetical protein DRG36_05380 [Deltaproteobacteria bacterium]|nr:MAG: hypothetical protein DRG36_05380 [Deltaproteobacteria bacterium]